MLRHLMFSSSPKKLQLILGDIYQGSFSSPSYLKVVFRLNSLWYISEDCKVLKASFLLKGLLKLQLTMDDHQEYQKFHGFWTIHSLILQSLMLFLRLIHSFLQSRELLGILTKSTLQSLACQKVFQFQPFFL